MEAFISVLHSGDGLAETRVASRHLLDRADKLFEGHIHRGMLRVQLGGIR